MFRCRAYGEALGPLFRPLLGGMGHEKELFGCNCLFPRESGDGMEALQVYSMREAPRLRRECLRGVIFGLVLLQGQMMFPEKGWGLGRGSL